jgi:hypothetical protein
MLLQHITENGYPFASIFEDAIRCSRRRHELAPAYLKATPGGFDLFYMGSRIQYQSLARWHPARCMPRSRRLTCLSQKAWPWPSRALGDVLQVPLYCLHTITITRRGCLELVVFSHQVIQQSGAAGGTAEG